MLRPKTLYFVYIFSPSNEHIIFVTTDLSFVKLTSCCLNLNLIPNVCVHVVLQYVITLITLSL